MTEPLSPGIELAGQLETSRGLRSEMLDLLRRIDIYGRPGGEGNKNLSVELLQRYARFEGGNPEAQLNSIKVSIGIIDQAIVDPQLRGLAFSGLSILMKGSVPEGSRLAQEIILRHLPIVRAELHSDKPAFRDFAGDLLIYAGMEKPEAWQVVEEEVDIFSQGLADPKATIYAITNVGTIMMIEDFEGKKPYLAATILTNFNTMLNNGEVNLEHYVKVMSRIAEIEDPNVARKLSWALYNFIGQIDLSLDVPFSWANSFSFPDEIRRNVPAIVALERKRRGITKLLHDKFGIRHFGRYPIDMLISQFDEFDKKGAYGIILVGEDDPGDAYLVNDSDLGKSSLEVWQEYFERFKGRYPIRIVEADERDITRTAIFLRRKYGEHMGVFTHASFHGNKGRLGLGIKLIRRSQLAGKDFRAFSSVLHPDAEVVLDACLTAKRHGQPGIAVLFADKLGRTVFGSTAYTESIDVSVTSEDHPPKFNVVFNGNPRSSKRIEPSQKLYN